MRRWLACTVALFLGCALAVEAEPVTFHFAPPVGSAFLDREMLTTEIRVGNNRQIHTIASLSTVRIRREAGAIYVAHRYDQIAAAEQGKPFTTPPEVEAMKGAEIVHVLRPDGTLLRVDGYRQLAARALPKMKGEAKASLEKYVAEGRQDDRDRAAWYELEMLLGQTLELDRDYFFDAAWSDDSGWMAHQTLVRLGPWVKHPIAGRLLTVKLAYVPNARAAVPEATPLVARFKSRLDPLKPGKFAPGLKLEGTATWLIDPATMMTWKIQSHRKVSEPMQVSQELGITLVTEETVEKNLEPAPAPAKN